MKIDGVEVKNVDAVKDYCGIVLISVMNEEEEIKEELIFNQGIEECNVITYNKFIAYTIKNGHNISLPKSFNAFHTIYLGISNGQRFGDLET